MTHSAAQKDLLDRFENQYVQAATPVMRTVVDSVFCCGHVGTSWTTRDEADALVGLLRLAPGTLLLDLGAGAGWPGLHLARESGCRAVLADLPETGLAIARDRAERDGIADRVETLRADAARVPRPDGAFDAINQSDLLCCLPHKRAVLAECRRLIRHGGRLVLSVILVAPGLSRGAYRRAVDCSPDFVETGTAYPDLLRATGWRIAEARDLTPEYETCCARQIDADAAARPGLTALLGTEAVADRRDRWTRKLAAIRGGLVRRELFVAEPARS